MKIKLNTWLMLLLALAGFCSANAAIQTLPFTDHFAYSEGNLYTVGTGVWDISGGGGVEATVSNAVAQTSPAGFATASGKGVHWSPSSTSRRSVLQFTTVPNADGNTVYVSMLVNVQAAPSAARFIGYLDNNSSSQTTPQLGIFVDNGPKIGVGKKASTPGVTTTTNMPLATTHLVVVRYTFKASGDDQADLWVDPSVSDYGATIAPTSLGSTTGATDPTSLSYFQIHSTSGAGPVILIDELRIGATWADVVPAGGTPIGEKLGFTSQPANTAPGATLSPVVVQVQNAVGAPIASNAVPVTLALTNVSGTLSGTLTQNTDATGKATFSDLSIDLVGTKQITATASGIGTGLASIVSSNFNIAVPVVGAQLVFTTQPPDTQVASVMTPSVVVQIQDSINVSVSSNNVPITLTLSTGTGLMGGTATRNTDATGKATFNDLTFSIAGAGKQVTAAASGIGEGLAGAVSSTFTITAAAGGSGSNLLITGSQMLPAGFKVQGSNSTAGIFTQILGATRPDEPAANWVIVNYQNADGSGQTTFTNPVSPAMPDAFYRLRTGDTTTKLQPPSIGIPPQSQIVSPGATATFSVTATGPMLQYLWYFNGIPIPGATSSNLTILNAQAGNVGNYFVAVASPAGNVNSAVVTLGVGNVAPVITSQPQNQTNNAGGTAIFNVGATGTATLTYQWYFNNSTLLAGQTNLQLLLAGVTTNAAGNYRCTVANGFGSTNSANASLTVNPVPTELPDTNIVGWAAYAGVTGGSNGTVTTVTTYAALRAACRLAGPIIIQVDGILVPNESYCYIEGYDKTIVGIGTNSGLAGAGFRASGTNIIIANLSFNSTNSNSDGVTIDNSSHGTGRNIWVDHCTFYDCTDGSVDVTKGADYVTISWCKFHYAPVAPGVVNHEFVNLLGSSDSDNAANFHVTFHHNWYSDYCRERMPSVRFGRVHVFNNYYDCVGNNYCVRTRINAEVLVESNYFIGVQNPWERFVTSGSAGLLKAAGNVTNNCTFVNGWVSGAVVIPGNDTLGSELNPPPYTQSPFYYPPLTPASDVPYYAQTYAGHGKYPYVP